MSRPDVATRLAPWLLLSAFLVTLSTLALRDAFDSPTRPTLETPPVPVVVLAR